MNSSALMLVVEAAAITLTCLTNFQLLLCSRLFM